MVSGKARKPRILNSEFRSQGPEASVAASWLLDSEFRILGFLASGLLLLMTAGCANYKFMRAFEPLLNKELAIDKQYREFEGSLPNDKHWQENMSILKGMADEKADILQKLKAITPNKKNEALYSTLIEDLNNSVAYLNLETTYFHKTTEFALWQTNYFAEGMDRAPASTKKEFLKAKDEVLRLQAEMTVAADKCNTSEERLAKLLQEKDLRRNHEPLKYTRYHKEHVGFKIK